MHGVQRQQHDGADRAGDDPVDQPRSQRARRSWRTATHGVRRRAPRGRRPRPRRGEGARVPRRRRWDRRRWWRGTAVEAEEALAVEEKRRRREWPPGASDSTRAGVGTGGCDPTGAGVDRLHAARSPEGGASGIARHCDSPARGSCAVRPGLDGPVQRVVGGSVVGAAVRRSASTDMGTRATMTSVRVRSAADNATSRWLCSNRYRSRRGPRPGSAPRSVRLAPLAARR